MCQALKVSRSGYYSWIKRPKSKRMRDEEMLIEEIKKIHEKSRRTYGSPRITEELNDNGIKCGKKRIARIMKKSGVRAKIKRKYKATTNSKHNYPVAENLLKQDFTTSGINKVWASDITYIWTYEGWLYLAVIMDIYCRKIVGWAMSERQTKELVKQAFLQAVLRYLPEPGLIHHSDRGSQYASYEYQDLLKGHGVIQSMSKKGDCYDNAIVETFFHTLKTELVYREEYRTRNQAKKSIFEYIEVWYNRQRRHSSLGYKSPLAFEQLFQKQMSRVA